MPPQGLLPVNSCWDANLERTYTFYPLGPLLVLMLQCELVSMLDSLKSKPTLTLNGPQNHLLYDQVTECV